MYTETKSTDQIGLEYQDWLIGALAKEGIIFQPYSSRKYQFEHGESWSGLEVKFDSQLRLNGNVFLEHHEKRRAANPNWIESGFLRNDCWQYLVGNYKSAFIFGTGILQGIWKREHQNHGLNYFIETDVTISVGTSRGALMPYIKAEKLCLKHLVFFD